MKPIFIILYAVIITLLLTLVFPRFRQGSSRSRLFSLLAIISGGIALLVTTYLAFLG